MTEEMTKWDKARADVDRWLQERLREEQVRHEMEKEHLYQKHAHEHYIISLSEKKAEESSP